MGRDQAGHRGEVDGPSVAVLRHLPRGRLGAEEGAGEIDIEPALLVLAGDLEEGRP